jgi:GNAT superfamily N-acetyltransferase
VEIRRANENDKSIVLDIYRDCADWLRSKGVDQWGYYLTEEAAEVVDRRFLEGEVYIASVDGQDAAVAVIQWQDSFWGERGNDPKAGFLHGIGVRRAFAGRELGRDLLDWSMQQARERGKTMFRLDCMFHNPKLVQYYKDAGFKEAGIAMWGERKVQLLERAI